jgi:hypothetical protein
MVHRFPLIGSQEQRNGPTELQTSAVLELYRKDGLGNKFFVDADDFIYLLLLGLGIEGNYLHAYLYLLDWQVLLFLDQNSSARCQMASVLPRHQMQS